jgi:tyrosinase
MGCSILFLCVLCVLAHLHLACAHASNEVQPQKCSKLLTRKEWRTLTQSEKAEWVGAVKVRTLLPIM